MRIRMHIRHLFLLVGLTCGVATASCTRESADSTDAAGDKVIASDVQDRRSTDRRRIKPVIKARTLSLDELTTTASRIIQGTVQSVSVRDVELLQNNEPFVAEIQEVRIKVSSVIKGNVDLVESLVIRQYASLAQSVEEGEQVLWYLPDESELGLSAPLGVYSGHFKIVASEEYPDEQVVVNLAFNEGLWSGESLWTGTQLSEQDFQKTLSAQSSGVEYERLLAMAARPYRAGPVPLKIVTSASAAIVEESE